MADVGIVGAGLLGTTLAHLIALHKDASVALFTENARIARAINSESVNPRLKAVTSIHPGVTAETDLAAFVRANKTLILTKPPSALKALMPRMAVDLEGDHILVHTLRYLSGLPLQTTTQQIREQTVVRKTGYLSGPVILNDLHNRHPGAFVLASPFQSVRRHLEEILGFPWQRLYFQEDLVATEWSSAMANIGLLSVGVARGMGLGAGTQSLLISRMTTEIKHALDFLGHDIRMADGMAGIGIMMAGSDQDSFYLLGQRLGKSRDAAKAMAETRFGNDGIDLIASVYHWAQRENVYLPITEAMYRLFVSGDPLDEVLQWLMSRPFKNEFD
jgi:glycerol-3-phosphate dehydrogenase (NAD(P)+)